MQTYYFILDESNYKYYSSHFHSQLFHSNVPSYSTYSDAKKEIDRLRKLYPENKLNIYAVFTTLTEVEDIK